MIKLTQKEYDLLTSIVNYKRADENDFKKVATNNANVASLVAQGLINSRPKAGSGIHLEVVALDLGIAVVNNTVEHEIVLDHSEETADEVEATTDNVSGALASAEEVSADVDVAEHQYQLEDNVPIPTDTTRRPRASRYKMPLDKMAVGQSFLVPFKEGEDVDKGRKRVTSSVSQTRKRLFGSDSTVRFVTKTVENGYRVWRKA